MKTSLLLIIFKGLAFSREGFLLVILTRIANIDVTSSDGTIQLNSIILENSFLAMQMRDILSLEQPTGISIAGLSKILYLLVA
jgi:hypothetical protein